MSLQLAAHHQHGAVRVVAGVEQALPGAQVHRVAAEGEQLQRLVAQDAEERHVAHHGKGPGEAHSGSAARGMSL